MWFRWQGKTSTDNYIVMTSLPTVHQTSMNTEEIFIPNAINHKYSDQGYNCFDLSIDIAYIGEEDETTFTNRMNTFLRNPLRHRFAGRLVFGNSPYLYYTAKLISQVDFSNFYRFRTATLTFRCQPFKHRTWWADDSVNPSESDYDDCDNFDMFSRDTHTVAYANSCRIAPVQNRKPKLIISSEDFPSDAKWLEIVITCKPTLDSHYAILEQGKKYVVERHYIVDVGTLGTSLTNWEMEIDTETEKFWFTFGTTTVDITSIVNNQDSYPTILGQRFFDITAQMVRDRYKEVYEQYSYNRPINLGVGQDKLYLAYYDDLGDLMTDESVFNVTYYSMQNEL